SFSREADRKLRRVLEESAARDRVVSSPELEEDRLPAGAPRIAPPRVRHPGVHLVDVRAGGEELNRPGGWRRRRSLRAQPFGDVLSDLIDRVVRAAAP